MTTDEKVARILYRVWGQGQNIELHEVDYLATVADSSWETPLDTCLRILGIRKTDLEIYTAGCRDYYREQAIAVLERIACQQRNQSD